MKKLLYRLHLLPAWAKFVVLKIWIVAVTAGILIAGWIDPYLWSLFNQWGVSEFHVRSARFIYAASSGLLTIVATIVLAASLLDGPLD